MEETECFPQEGVWSSLILLSNRRSGVEELRSNGVTGASEIDRSSCLLI